jgi:hypothetical protein
LTGCHKAHGAAQAATFELMGHVAHSLSSPLLKDWRLVF